MLILYHCTACLVLADGAGGGAQGVGEVGEEGDGAKL